MAFVASTAAATSMVSGAVLGSVLLYNAGKTVYDKVDGLIAEERKTWPKKAEEGSGWRNPHLIEYDDQCRQENLDLLRSTFQDGDQLILAYSEGEFCGVKFHHYFISNGESIMEFGTSRLNYERARVRIMCSVKETSAPAPICQEKMFFMNSEIRERMQLVLGMRNYSLCLRNCEHVARFVLFGRWSSMQMAERRNALFDKLRKQLMEEAEPFVNVLPDTARSINEKNTDANSLDESAPSLYSFLNALCAYRPKAVTHFLDSIEIGAKSNSKNVLVIGAIGSGKSHLINFLFNRPILRSRSATQEVTFVIGEELAHKAATASSSSSSSSLLSSSTSCSSSLSSSSSSFFSSSRIIFADTVGLLDMALTEREIDDVIRHRVAKNMRFIDRVIIVVNQQKRMTSECKHRLKEMMKWAQYEKNANNFCFVCTHCDELDDEEKREKATKLIRSLRIRATHQSISTFAPELTMKLEAHSQSMSLTPNPDDSIPHARHSSLSGAGVLPVAHPVLNIAQPASSSSSSYSSFLCAYNVLLVSLASESGMRSAMKEDVKRQYGLIQTFLQSSSARRISTADLNVKGCHII